MVVIHWEHQDVKSSQTPTLSLGATWVHGLISLFPRISISNFIYDSILALQCFFLNVAN